MQNIVTLVLDMLRIYLLPSIYKLILLKIKYIKDVITFLKFDTVTVQTFILFASTLFCFQLSSEKWKECLTEDKLLWAPTQECYSPLEQGPCKDNEWLVLKDDLPGPTLESVCIKKRWAVVHRYLTQALDHSLV